MVLLLIMVVTPLLAMGENAAQIPDSLSPGDSAGEGQKGQAGESGTMKVLRASSNRVETMSDLEYVIGAVSAEMPPTYHTEALKAQAAACYTFALRSRNEQLKEALDHALEGSSEERMLEINGRVYQLLANPVRVDRVVSGAVILVLDVTEKQKAEVMRREFSANVSHELKTPLMSISGYAEIIENNMVKPEDIPKFAGRIHSEASRLSSLVEDIIKLSRLDENDQSIPMEEVDLMQICRDVEGHLSIRAKEQQVKMTLRGESCRIKGARQVLYEMIYNLCDNAIKYNRKDGEVEVTVSRGRNGRAVVSVADTGIGIAKEDQERIFERFYRVDKSHSRETGGTGLGLSIVKHGAILHDAKIKIESTLGTGTKIILEF